jgi:preflagellin peptidase FlaK
MIEYHIAAAAAMLIISSYFDLKSREVTDTLWTIFFLIGVSLYIYDFITIGMIYNWFSVVVVVGATAGLAFLLYYLGFFGGADLFALILISVILPLYDPPLYALPIYHSPILVWFYPVTAVMVLTNAAVWVMALPLYFFLRNLWRLLRSERIFAEFEDEPRWKKMAVMFLGYRMNNAKERDFYLSLERIIDGKRRFDFRLIKAEDVMFLKGRDVWGSPGLPYLFFWTLGFFTMLLLGDLVTLFMDSLVSILIV